MTLRNIPVDLSQLTYIMVTSAPEVRTDLNTGEIRTDRITKLPLFLVGVLVKVEGERKAYVLDVQVPGEPQGIIEGSFVEVEKMQAVPWDRDGRSGVTYRVASIRPVKPSATMEAPAPAGLPDSTPTPTDSGTGAATGRGSRGGGSS
ncbi:MAG TPA: hypothetical protein VL551_35000 [Actinospica sp.]|nr:hypothetical protein [Actinospica sp.]